MIVATPVVLDPLVPPDWNRWWAVWQQYAAPLKKTKDNHNPVVGKHFGFDVFRHPMATTDYEAVKIDLESIWPEFYQQIMDTIPVTPWVIRFVMSTGDFPAHTDNSFRNWQLRSMFYHPDESPQWYFTRLDGTDKRFLQLPPTTNWFAYLDGACKHGTHFVRSKPKILLQVFAQTFQTKLFVDKQLGQFPELDQYRIAY